MEREKGDRRRKGHRKVTFTTKGRRLSIRNNVVSSFEGEKETGPENQGGSTKLVHKKGGAPRRDERC